MQQRAEYLKQATNLQVPSLHWSSAGLVGLVLSTTQGSEELYTV